MRTPQTVNLPVTTNEFDVHDQQTMRRTVEHYLASIRNDILEVRDGTDKEASLAMRRHQFLLMGG